MTRYNVAMFGVFDLENYGDLLFPVVFDKFLQSKNIDYELFLFSSVGLDKSISIPGKVYSVGSLEAMHIEHHFDCFIVGGGSLIHFNKIYQMHVKDTVFREYNIFETWVYPCLFAMENQIKVLWNAPGVPFSFDDKLHPFVRQLCDYVDYICVRNGHSKENLVNCKIEASRITIVPDTVLSISKYFDDDALRVIRDSVLPFYEKYVVFHANRHIPDDQIPGVVRSISYLQSKGFAVILLPLAYTHNDQDILSTINERCGQTCLTFSTKLTPLQMLSILAGCTLYIGVSFHGCITALSYGKKAIAYNYMDYRKTTDLFADSGIANYCITSSSELLKVVPEILKDPQIVNLQSANERILNHFNFLFHSITDNILPDSFNRSNNVKQFACQAISELAVSRNENSYLESQVKWYENDEIDLRNRLDKLYANRTSSQE